MSTSPVIYEFTFNDSSTGRAKVTAAPSSSIKEYEAQTYTAKRGATSVSGTFIKFYPAGSTYGFFMKLDDYKLRVGGNENTYKADWDRIDLEGKLSCDIWDDDGRLVGQGGIVTRGVPSSLIARKSRVDTTDSRRLAIQVEIWQSIARDQSSVSRSGRLWKSRTPISPLLELFVVANEQFLTRDELKASIKDVSATEFNTWLKITFLTKKELSARTDLRCISQHLLGIYASYMTENDLKRLITAQTTGRQVQKDGMRAFPTTAQAEEFHKAMVDSGKYKGKFHEQTVTALTGARPKEDRVDASAIMGQSANVWGKKFWPGDTAEGTAAEWLHRSAYSFGPMTSASWQSEANLIFGTYEANGNMTRAESSIDTIVASIASIFEDTGKGKLNTKIVNKGDYSVLGAKGLEKLTIPAWVSDSGHSYSWLSPELKYWGGFTATHNKLATPINYPFSTQFHTFNCYTPLSIEGQLDRRAWKTYFEKKYGYLRAQKRKADTDSDGSGPSRAPRSIVADILPDPINPTINVPTPLVALPSLPSLPSLSELLPDYMKNSLNLEAWLAALNESPILRIADTVVRNPVFSDTPTRPRRSPADDPPLGGFAISGEIDLFGISGLKATFKSWHGPPPADIEIGAELPICQQAEIDNIAILTFLPWVVGTPLEKAHLSKVNFTYQNYGFVSMKPIGWSVSAELVVDEQFGSMNQILSQVLQIPPNSLTFHVTASLGLNQSWSSLPSLASFVLQGLIYVKDTTNDTYQAIRLCDGITLSHIGVRVFGVSTAVLGSSGKSTTSYGFSLLGELWLDIPASTTPLEFDFEISEFGGTAEINALLKGDIWKNALGLGFNLETVTFSSSFIISSPLKTLDLAISAVLDAQPTVATLIGTYSVGGAFTVSADIENFTYDGILDLYAKFSGGEEVVLPTNEEFSIGAASITLSSTDGLSVMVSNIKYGDYVAANAALHFGSNGIVLKGELENIDIPEFGVKLVDVAINASFVKYGASKSSSVELDVVVELTAAEGFPKIRGTVHVYKEPQDQKLQWTVYGEFEGLGKSTRLGNLFSELNGTFLGDVALDDLALVVASKDEPALSTMNPRKFPIKRGLQICAIIDTIEQINQILRHPAPGLILSVTLSDTSGFVLDIDFPTAGIIHLGSGIQTDPIELQINTKPLRLMIDAGLKIPVPKSPDPLDFKLALAIQNEEVYASGQMIGSWNNPFDISPRVSIGPNLALEIGIILPQFAVTGIPSAFGFAGGLSIGDIRGDVAVQINEDPSQELISGKLEHLGIQDLVKFTSDVINFDLPMLPNFIELEKLSLYISTGVMIGTILYPPGFSFEADIKVFNSEFKASAQIVQDTLTIKASIHNLKVGPLSVTGSKGGDAKFDLTVGPSKQHVLVDGAINILGSEIALLLNLDILPIPKFYFDLSLHLTPLLTFSVNAQMKGAADIHDLSKLEFVLHAVMEQHIIEYVVKRVNDSLEAAKEAAEESIEAAEIKVDRAKAEMKKAIFDAQQKVDEAYASWKAHEKEVRENSEKVINDYNTELAELEGKVKQARIDWQLSAADAERKLREVQADAAVKMAKADADVIKARSDWDAEIDRAEAVLEDAKKDLHRKFGSAEHDIDAAKAKVDSLQNQIDDIQHSIDKINDAPPSQFMKRALLPGLYAALGAIEAAKYIADKILDIAKGVVQATDFVTTQGVVTAAEKALEAVKTGGDGLLIAARETVEEVYKATEASIKAAEDVVEAADTVGQETLKVAQRALDDFREGSVEALKAARDAVDELVNSAEWLAYQAAKGVLNETKHTGEWALGVANSALGTAKDAGVGILDIAEDFFTGLASAFNITRIEITTDLAPFAGNFSFDAVVKGTLVGEQFTLELVLDLKDVSSFIQGIFLEVVRVAPRK